MSNLSFGFFIVAGLCFFASIFALPEPWYRRVIGIGLTALTVGIATR